jgi:multimeric flavodoxin WrbA
MKVLALLGSPRPQGNTATLMQSVLEGLSQIENTTITSYALNDLKIEPCTACDACLGKTDRFCIIDDDMARLYPAFIEADLVVMASPIYWWSVSAQLKLFIDRLYGLNREKNPQYYRDKRIILVLTYEDGDPNSGAELTISMFKEICDYTGMKLVDVVRYSSGKRHVRECPEILEEARELAQRLNG